MTHYERKQVLIPFKRFFGYSLRDDGDPREKFPYFKIYDYSYGTKGYKYLLLAYDSTKHKWVRWPGVQVHTDLEKNFRLPTNAELVLYGPF